MVAEIHRDKIIFSQKWLDMESDEKAHRLVFLLLPLALLYKLIPLQVLLLILLLLVRLLQRITIIHVGNKSLIPFL
jgi:hypothetical protein